jgi:DNA-binding response OmpR family regulator
MTPAAQLSPVPQTPLSPSPRVTAQEAASSIAFDLTRARDALERGKPNAALVLVELALASAQALSEALPYDHLAVGDLVVDLPARQARLAGVPLPLAGRPFELLALLATEPGRAWPREVLYERLWGMDLSRTSRTLDRAAGRVRDVLGYDWVKTVVGVGYALTPPAEHAAVPL